MSKQLSIREEILWHKPENVMPDADETVLVFSDDADDPVWLGYYDGEYWLNVEGLVLPPVILWAEMPKGAVSL